MVPSRAQLKEGVMSRIRLAVAFTFLAYASAAIAQSSSTSATGIAGTVVSKQSGQAVADAAVSVAGSQHTARTSAGGRFRIEGVPAGPVVLVVKAPGFLDTRTADLSAVAGQTTQVTVELEPTPNYMERVQVTA